MLVRAFIGFGANINDPVQQILNARKHLLQNPDITDLQNSSLYLSSPIGYRDQPDFVNCVGMINTSLSALALLHALQDIEVQLGRKRDPDNQNAPRVIDLDILLYGNENIDLDSLVVPHPRMTERLFVLEPLCELDSNVLVNNTMSVAQVLKNGIENDLFIVQRLYRLG